MSSLIYMVHCMPFAERLSTIRKERHLTQEALAERVGLTKAQIYRYEKANSQPTLDVIKRLAMALSVTADQLVFEEDERQPDDSLVLLLEGFLNSTRKRNTSSRR